MPLHLGQIDDKIIDLKKSIIDEPNSDPEKGKYVFHKKVYYKNSRDFGASPWVFKPCSKETEDRDGWAYLWDASPLTLKDGFFWEGARYDNGEFIFKDVVMMKIPVEKYLDVKASVKKKEETRTQSLKQKFQDDARSAGMGVRNEELEKIEQDYKDRVLGLK